MRDMAGGREAVKGGQMLVLNTVVGIGLSEKVGSEPRIAVSEGTAARRSGGSGPVPGQGAPAAHLRSRMAGARSSEMGPVSDLSS